MSAQHVYSQVSSICHLCFANLQDLLEGTKDTIMPWVCDVRDIARGHIRAAEIPEAKGRHLVTQGATVPTKRLVDALSKAFPDFKFPSVKKEASKDVIDNSKVGAEHTRYEQHETCHSVWQNKAGQRVQAKWPALDRSPLLRNTACPAAPVKLHQAAPRASVAG